MANYAKSKPVFTLSDADRKKLQEIAKNNNLDIYNVDVDQALKAAFKAGYDDAKSWKLKK